MKCDNPYCGGGFIWRRDTDGMPDSVPCPDCVHDQMEVARQVMTRNKDVLKKLGSD